MAVLVNSFVSVPNRQDQFLSDQSVGSTRLLIGHNRKTILTKQSKSLTVRAGGDGGRPSGASIFVGGFVLGGVIVGTLSAIYAPQISKALAGTDRKELMRKLPKFIYDEEKALEKTRKILAEKIAQLNTAIDDVSAQLHANDPPTDGSPATTNEVETSY